MSDTTMIAFAALAFLALLMAVAAIGWLETVSKRLSAFGKRVLESKDIEKTIEAADKMASLESRLAAFENRINQNQNQHQEHETNLSKLAINLGLVEQMMDQHTADFANASEKILSLESRMTGYENRADESQHHLEKQQINISELAARLGTTEQLANSNGTGLTDVSEKTASLESRITGCEDRAEQRQNQLLEQEQKANGLAARLESAEQMINKQAEDLVQANQSMKSVADKIQDLEEFQAATEKFHKLLFTAFSNMEKKRSEGSLETGPKSRQLNGPLSIKDLDQVSALAKRVTDRSDAVV